MQITAFEVLVSEVVRKVDWGVVGCCQSGS